MPCLSAVWLGGGRGQLLCRPHLRRGQECPPFLAMLAAGGAAVGIVAILGYTLHLLAVRATVAELVPSPRRGTAYADSTPVTDLPGLQAAC